MAFALSFFNACASRSAADIIQPPERSAALQGGAPGSGLGDSVDGGGQQMLRSGYDEHAPWNVVSFTDPRDSSVYDIIDGRVIVAFREYPILPIMDGNYFDNPLVDFSTFYASAPYPASILELPEVATFVAAENLTVYSDWPEVGGLAALLPEGQTVADAVANWPLEYPTLISQVSPDVIVQSTFAPDDDHDPNDDRFGQQWAIYDPEVGSPTSAYQIGIARSWRHLNGPALGSASVCVAILDTGVHTGIIDLMPNSTLIGSNTGDSRSSTEFNTRALGGGAAWPWIYNLPENRVKIAHGTAVAGIISAKPNDDPSYLLEDGKDIAGIAANCQYFPVAMKFKNGYSRSSELNAYSAIGAVRGVYNSHKLFSGKTVPRYNIEVVNCSFGNRDNFDNEVGWRHLNNLSPYMLFVCGAGNDGSNIRSLFPAKHPLAVSVAAYNTYGMRSIWSQQESSVYAPDVDIAGPGTSNMTCDLPGYSPFGGLPMGYAEGQTAYFNGTSSAAPHVAAVAAVMFSMYPNLTPANGFARLRAVSRTVFLPDPTFSNIRGVNAYLVLNP